MVAEEIDKPFTRSKAEWFIFYCLCSKIQMMINKATFMIVIPTNPKKSRYVILNNADSTILTTPHISISQPEVVEVVCKHQRVKGGNTLRLFSFSMYNTI